MCHTGIATCAMNARQVAVRVDILSFVARIIGIHVTQCILSLSMCS